MALAQASQSILSPWCIDQVHVLRGLYLPVGFSEPAANADNLRGGDTMAEYDIVSEDDEDCQAEATAP